jgi:NitT/TauT family transport system permease protein
MRISWVATTLSPVILLGGLLCCWHLAVKGYQINPIILPGPIEVANSLWNEREVLAVGFRTTGMAAIAGLAASVFLGGLIAVVFSLSSVVRTAVYPYLIFLQTVPIVAIAPLLILWSGYNFRTVVLVTIIISIFPIVSNTTSGLLSINPNLRDLFRLNGASSFQTLMKLRIPAAISHLVLGMRISCGLAVIGAIIGEFFVGNSGRYDGLGTIMTRWQGRNYTSGLIAAILVSTFLGIVFFVAVNQLNQRFLRRWTIASNLDADS